MVFLPAALSRRNIACDHRKGYLLVTERHMFVPTNNPTRYFSRYTLIFYATTLLL